MAEDEEEVFRYHTGANRPTEHPDAIKFIKVHKAFGANHVLRGLDLGIPEGQVSMILGPSGTGKSVCIKHIVGLLYPDQGDVIVAGHIRSARRTQLQHRVLCAVRVCPALPIARTLQGRSS